MKTLEAFSRVYFLKAWVGGVGVSGRDGASEINQLHPYSTDTIYRYFLNTSAYFTFKNNHGVLRLIVTVLNTCDRACTSTLAQVLDKKQY